MAGARHAASGLQGTSGQIRCISKSRIIDSQLGDIIFKEASKEGRRHAIALAMEDAVSARTLPRARIFSAQAVPRAQNNQEALLPPCRCVVARMNPKYDKELTCMELAENAAWPGRNRNAIAYCAKVIRQSQLTAAGCAGRSCAELLGMPSQQE